MLNLLKQINLLMFILTMGKIAHSQNFEHRISAPMISYQITNISQFDKGLNNNYINKFYLPNLRYEICYNKKVIISLENYYFGKSTDSPKSKEGEIRNLKINSYSILSGYSFNEINKFRLSLGTGLSYNYSWIGLYVDYYPSEWEGWICYEYNKFGPVFWTSIDYAISKKLFLKLNLRNNPMFKPFEKTGNKDCITPHNHNNLNYGIGQFAIGYKL